MEKIDLLKYRGNVLGFDDFTKKHLKVNETITFTLNKNGGDIQVDGDAVEAIWSVIETECGGKMENMLKFLQKGTDAVITERDVASHIMDLVDDHLNNEVIIKKGHQYIKNFEKFMEKSLYIDYASVVEVLMNRLAGNDKEQPKFLNLIIDLLKSTTDVDCGDEEGEEEEE